jgi:hypothetical protein
MATLKVFGIRHIKTGQPLRISIFSNEGNEYCNNCGANFELSDYGRTLYTTTNLETAKKALKENPRWFNASLECPEWPKNFDPKDYETFLIGCIMS